MHRPGAAGRRVAAARVAEHGPGERHDAVPHLDGEGVRRQVSRARERGLDPSAERLVRPRLRRYRSGDARGQQHRERERTATPRGHRLVLLERAAPAAERLSARPDLASEMPIAEPLPVEHTEDIHALQAPLEILEELGHGLGLDGHGRFAFPGRWSVVDPRECASHGLRVDVPHVKPLARELEHATAAFDAEPKERAPVHRPLAHRARFTQARAASASTVRSTMPRVSGTL